MLWHVVKFRLKPELDQAQRDEYLALLRSTAGVVPTLRFLRAEFSIDEPDVIGLLTGFDDLEGLEVYRDHPAHQPVTAMTRQVAAEVIRFDIVTDDPPDSLPLDR